MFTKLIIIFALVRLLRVWDKHFACAGIYAGARLTLGLLLGAPFLPALVSTAIVMAAASLYFWLLDRYSENTIAYVLIAALGLPLVLL